MIMAINKVFRFVVTLVLVAIFIASCAPTEPPVVIEAPPPVVETAAPVVQTTEPTSEPTVEPIIYKIAVLFAGTTKDGGWNTSGFEAAEAAGALDNWEMSYSERVEVADLARIIDEYASSGYAVIWAHGAQFTSTIVDTLADQYPSVSFIVEGDGPNDTAAAKNNVKYLDRNHAEAVYPLGYTAALWTRTKKVAYIGALPLPYVWASIRTI